MKKRWQYIKLALPPAKWIVIAVIFYLLTYSLDLLIFGILKVEPNEDTLVLSRLRIGILGVYAGLYGLYRVIFYHPSYSRKYRFWLNLSPWDYRKRLPLGPIHLVETDVLFLSILTMLAYVNVPELVIAPLIAFLCAYVLMLWIALNENQGHTALAVLFLASFTYYPFRNPIVSVFVLLGLYGLCYWSTAVSLENFPWNTKWWQLDPVNELRKQSKILISRSWPFRYIIYHNQLELSVTKAFLISFIITWYVHVIKWPAGGLYEWWLLMKLVFYLVLFRTLVYVSMCLPPISLLGRLFTFRLIIPRYDKVLIMPICVILAGIATPQILRLINLPGIYCFELTLFVVLFLTMALPPKYKEWQLTAPGRLYRKRAIEKNLKPPRSTDTVIADLVSSKKNIFKS